MSSIFKKSIELNMKIEKFLNIISDSMLLFEKAIHAYLNKNTDEFNTLLTRICNLETEADDLESEIKITLYKYMLLPDARADVLSLIKSIDNIIDMAEEISKEFNIQKPEFPEDIIDHFKDLIKNTLLTVEALVLASKSFLNELHLVSTHINKVNFYEHEVDILEDKINDQVFNKNIVSSLAEKLQLKAFISSISSISDEAEVIGEKLTIFTIKREV